MYEHERGNAERCYLVVFRFLPQRELLVGSGSMSKGVTREACIMAFSCQVAGSESNANLPAPCPDLLIACFPDPCVNLQPQTITFLPLMAKKCAL